jgi:antitoxin ChpS
MLTTTLRKVGGSVMMAVPSAVLDLMHLQAGAKVALAVDGERLVVEPATKPRYTLEELLAQCDASAPVAEEDRAWFDSPPAWRELL